MPLTLELKEVYDRLDEGPEEIVDFIISISSQTRIRSHLKKTYPEWFSKEQDLFGEAEKRLTAKQGKVCPSCDGAGCFACDKGEEKNA